MDQTLKKQNKIKKSILFILLISVIVGGLIAGWLYWQKSHSNIGVDESKYQAVFFSNGQVYFGKLQKLSSDHMKLTNVFYLRANNQQGQDSQNPQTAEADTELQLIKLGNELHGPEDEMIFSKEQILYFENLKHDGKVVSSILKYSD